ncbi:FecR family protein [Bacteroides sp. MSB163]|uniref:FecR family protein n=1 Tax=Bacteroides maternus TaxID=3117552 RepID=UPI002ED91771
METKTAHIDELISTFLAEGLEVNALEELKTWIAESEENRVYFMKCQEIWFSAVQENGGEYYDQEKAFERFEKRLERQKAEKRKTKNFVWRSLYKYAAAILLLGFISYFSYQKGEDNLRNALAEIEVEAPAGSQTRLHLPDGTTVLLNSDSRITYAQDFGVNSREVTLQGEGYFEVAHNRKIPFYVRTEDVQVRVLGTKFNFRDYPEDGEVVVSLIEGKVALKNKIRQEADLVLIPDEQMVLDKKEKVMKKESINAQTVLRWAEGCLSFDETPLLEVAKILERSYGVKIEFTEESLKELRFYGNFNRTKQGINDILDALSATGKVHYTLKGEKIVLY